MRLSMTKSMVKIEVDEHRRPSRRLDVHDDDAEFGSLAYVKANSPAFRYRSAAVTLCLLRGKGKIKINDSSVEYHEGKWIEIPRKSEYEILPETDTVMLELAKPTRTFGDSAENPAAPITTIRSSGSAARAR
jgi:mannose-6-phosphate isomerase-like protein (cupin superfamily)